MSGVWLWVLYAHMHQVSIEQAQLQSSVRASSASSVMRQRSTMLALLRRPPSLPSVISTPPTKPPTSFTRLRSSWVMALYSLMLSWVRWQVPSLATRASQVMSTTRHFLS